MKHCVVAALFVLLGIAAVPAVYGEEIDPAFTAAAKAWGLTLETEKAVYGPGEPVRAVVRADRDFYGAIVHVDANGTRTRLDAPSGAERLKGATSHVIPSEGGLFLAGPPYGEEALIIYIGRRAFPYFTATSDEPLLCPIGQRVAGAEKTESLSGTVADWAHIAVTTATFRTVP